MGQQEGDSTRRKGTSNMISGIMVIGCLAAFILFYTYYIVDLDKVVGMNLSARRYISAMEMTGYLTPAYKNGMQSELQQIGAYDISFAGSSVTPVAYGGTVILKVTGKIAMSRITGFDNGGFVREEGGSRDFTIKRQITAKY